MKTHGYKRNYRKTGEMRIESVDCASATARGTRRSSRTRRDHQGNCAKGAWDLSTLPSQIPVNLDLFENKKKKLAYTTKPNQKFFKNWNYVFDFLIFAESLFGLI